MVVLQFALGLAVMIVGAELLVRGAARLATALGLSPLVIGLTVVAYGTGAPELAVSVQASLSGQAALALGNVVGSNIFNVLAVLGCASLVAPAGIQIPPATLRFDIPVLIAVAVACLPIFFTGHVIARWEGGLFLAYYLAYLLYVLLAATQHRALPMFSSIMLVFVLPLTGITLSVLTVRAFRAK